MSPPIRLRGMVTRAAVAAALLAVGALAWMSEAREATPTGAGVMVAAVQYAGRVDAERLGCPADDHNCALEALVRRAAAAGAELVVTPEYALSQGKAEPLPALGTAPGPDSPLQQRFAALADELDVVLFIQLTTKAHPKGSHNSLLALGPDGRLAAVHHKFELFADENRWLVAGDQPTVFETAFGRVGMLVCADLYGPPAFHAATAEADLVVVAAQWTVAGAPRWPAAFAHDWQVPVVAANSSRAEAAGGGVFDAEGRLTSHRLRGDPIDLSTLPLP